MLQVLASVSNSEATTPLVSALLDEPRMVCEPGIVALRWVGITDGLGAFDNYDGTFAALMNHEIPPANGLLRQHGFAGAFVSNWIIRKSDLTVNVPAWARVRLRGGARSLRVPARSFPSTERSAIFVGFRPMGEAEWRALMTIELRKLFAGHCTIFKDGSRRIRFLGE